MDACYSLGCKKGFFELDNRSVFFMFPSAGLLWPICCLQCMRFPLLLYRLRAPKICNLHTKTPPLHRFHAKISCKSAVDPGFGVINHEKHLQYTTIPRRMDSAIISAARQMHYPRLCGWRVFHP